MWIDGYDGWKTRTPDEDLPVYSLCHVCQERHYTDDMICTEDGYICEACLENMEEEDEIQDFECKRDRMPCGDG